MPERRGEADVLQMRKMVCIVFGDSSGISEEGFKLVGEGRSLATRLGGQLECILVSDTGGEGSDLISGYLSHLHLVPEAGPLVDPESISKTVTKILLGIDPDLVLFPSTIRGNDLAARVAVELSKPLASTCLEVQAEKNGTLVARRALYAGAAHSTFAWIGERPYLVTIDMKPLEVPGPWKGEVAVSRYELEPSSSRLTAVSFQPGNPSSLDLAEANVVVGVGAGIGSRDAVEAFEEFSSLIGGTLGGSRVAVDLAWIPYEKQIGTSGKSITARVYLAFGISGAGHHMGGVRDARKIIAVNSDPGAAIFRSADLGIVGDLREILPHLLELLRSGEKD